MKFSDIGVLGLIVCLILGIIVSIVCAYFSYKQAQKKGYSEGGFAVLGFFLGVVGLIIALCIPGKNAIATNTAAAQTNAADALLKYKELLDKGVITQEEFDAKKKELLS